MRNHFRLGKDNQSVTDRVLRNIENLFVHEEEGSYYKLVRVSNFGSNGCIEYKSNSDRNGNSIS